MWKFRFRELSNLCKTTQIVNYKYKQLNFSACISNPSIVSLLNYHKKLIMLVYIANKNSTAESI